MAFDFSPIYEAVRKAAATTNPVVAATGGVDTAVGAKAKLADDAVELQRMIQTVNSVISAVLAKSNPSSLGLQPEDPLYDVVAERNNLLLGYQAKQVADLNKIYDAQRAQLATQTEAANATIASSNTNFQDRLANYIAIQNAQRAEQNSALESLNRSASANPSIAVDSAGNPYQSPSAQAVEQVAGLNNQNVSAVRAAQDALSAITGTNADTLYRGQLNQSALTQANLLAALEGDRTKALSDITANTAQAQLDANNTIFDALLQEQLAQRAKGTDLQDSVTRAIIENYLNNKLSGEDATTNEWQTSTKSGRFISNVVSEYTNVAAGILQSSDGTPDGEREAAKSVADEWERAVRRVRSAIRKNGWNENTMMTRLYQLRPTFDVSG